MDNVTPADIKAARKAFGMTQAEAGGLFGVADWTVKAWENGWQKPLRGQNRQALQVFVQAANGIDKVAVMDKALAHFKGQGKGDEFIEFVKRAITQYRREM